MCWRKTLKSYSGLKGYLECNFWYSFVALCYLAYDWVDSLDYISYEYSYGEKYATTFQSPLLKYHIRLCGHNLCYCCKIFWTWSRMCINRSLRNKGTLLCSIDYYIICEHSFLYESLCYFLYKGSWMGSWVASVRRRRRWRLINNKLLKRLNYMIKKYAYLFTLYVIFMLF